MLQPAACWLNRAGTLLCWCNVLLLLLPLLLLLLLLPSLKQHGIRGLFGTAQHHNQH
jgi:hypothetical protein